MTLSELNRLASGGENQFLEFKQYVTVMSQITEEIVGFLNSTGGKLLIGVKDDGHLSGLKFPEDDLSSVEDGIRKIVTPRVSLKSEIIPVNAKKSVIVLDIPEGEDKPYAALNDDSDQKTVYYRINDKCIKASRELRNILKQKNRERGQTIQYSDLEAEVLKVIEQYGQVTKDEIVTKTSFNSRNVSDCLIRLVTSKVLSIIPANSGDLYEYNQPG